MRSQSSGKVSISFAKVLKGVFLAYLLTIVLFIILALIMYFTRVSESIIPKAVVVISALSILLSGINTTKDLESMGWLHGGLVGLLYMGVLIIISFLAAPSFAFTLNVAIDLFISFLVGTVAGMTGVSL